MSSTNEEGFVTVFTCSIPEGSAVFSVPMVCAKVLHRFPLRAAAPSFPPHNTSAILAEAQALHSPMRHDGKKVLG